jgi:hypothetical protein
MIFDAEDNSKAIWLVTCNPWSGIQILDAIAEVIVQVSCCLAINDFEIVWCVKHEYWRLEKACKEYVTFVCEYLRCHLYWSLEYTSSFSNRLNFGTVVYAPCVCMYSRFGSASFAFYRETCRTMRTKESGIKGFQFITMFKMTWSYSWVHVVYSAYIFVGEIRIIVLYCLVFCIEHICEPSYASIVLRS